MALKNTENFSKYLSFLLRHHPENANLDMNNQGWVSVKQLIENINSIGLYKITLEELQNVVATDKKGRYRFSEDGTQIRACQGHSISWAKIEFSVQAPPEFLFHGTNEKAMHAIMNSGYIHRMERHAVHMQAAEAQAWRSARRWKGQCPVVLKIATARMISDGYTFSRSDNDVWLCEKIPTAYIVETLYHETGKQTSTDTSEVEKT